ncbi:MAG TPA: DNA polymerase III subunit gamma/tau [Thermoanaerobaculia bacterium]|nr:DNA polymerase III subunit gamma/tau [Thermoanaerobaculia bacterium]
MSYQVLARKWRPQTFASLVGQEPIVTALRNALTEGRIAQAYLFSGIRGVGKTTAARVLAKALNCERGPAADPCDDCLPCREITRGADLDVIEVDAATYSKVEQVRDLTESLRYGPARDRYKVVVIDEIHRLSRQAFDALLKIVEEPPPHLAFIFATTEIEAVPATILSRCQEFHFRRVSSPDVAALLRRISEAEGITASDPALRLIARAGEGSVRDAVALLDQLATFGSGTIADEEAVRLLGGLDTALFGRLLEAILGGDPLGVRGAVVRIEDEGWDPRHVFCQFLAYCRDALHLAMGGADTHVDLPVEEEAILAGRARAAGYENLLRLLQQLLASEQIVRRSEVGVLAVEIAWLRAAELPKLTRVEELLAGTKPPERPTAKKQEERRVADERPAPTRAPDPRPPDPPPLPQPEPAQPAEAADVVDVIIQELDKLRPSLAAVFAQHRPRFEGGALLVPREAHLEATLRRGNNRQILEKVLAAVGGGAARWQEDDGEPAAAAESEPPPPPVLSHPTVQAVLDIFNGRVERVEPHARPRED